MKPVLSKLDTERFDTLQGIISDLEAGSPMTDPQCDFLVRMRSRRNAIHSLKHYCWNKHTAIHCRLEGNVSSALTYERICEDIYESLPNEFKW